MDAVAAAPCGKCSNKVKKKGVQCEVCLKWYHLMCAEISEELYNGICKSEGGGIKWLCQGCDAKVGRMLVNLLDLMDKQEKTENRIDELKKEIELLRKETRDEKQVIMNRMDDIVGEMKGTDELKKEIALLRQEAGDDKQVILNRMDAIDGEMEGAKKEVKNYSQAVKERLSKEQPDKAIV